MSKKKSPHISVPEQLEQSTPKFLHVEKRVFTILPDGRMFIGQEKITDQLHSLLRDEAKNLQTMRLWEILNASVINEAYNLALIQSKDFDSVQFAKGLKHWSHFMMNVIHILAKEK